MGITISVLGFSLSVSIGVSVFLAAVLIIWLVLVGEFFIGTVLLPTLTSVAITSGDFFINNVNKINKLNNNFNNENNKNNENENNKNNENENNKWKIKCDDCSNSRHFSNKIKFYWRKIIKKYFELHLRNTTTKNIKNHLKNCSLCKTSLNFFKMIIPPPKTSIWWKYITQNQKNIINSYNFPWDDIRNEYFSDYTEDLNIYEKKILQEID